MAESHTANPSDPVPENLAGSGLPTDSTGSADTPGERPRLKLKQILTPISPHLKAPRPERDPRLATKAPGTPTPTPRAVPIEPEPEPDPEALKAEREGTIQTGPQSPESGAAPAPPPPEHPEGTQTGQVEDETTHQPEDEEAEPEEDYAELPRQTAPNWSRRLLLWLALPVTLVGAIAWLVLFLFQPAPEELARPLQPQASAVTQKADRQPAAATADLGPVELTLALEKETLDSYLQQLQQQEIVASTNPRGIFVNSVFIPEGSLVNPMFGLILVQLESSPEGTLIDLEDANRQPYRIALKK